MLEAFINANKDQLRSSDIGTISVKVVEFKKRRCDFVFNVDKVLTQKQN